MTPCLPVTLRGDDDRGIAERTVMLLESTPAWPGDCPWCPEQPDDTCTTLGAIARGEVDCHHRAQDGRRLPCLWLTAEQSPTGDATWWDGYVTVPATDRQPLRWDAGCTSSPVDDIRASTWRVHRPNEMEPIEAAALRAAALRSVTR